MRRMLRLLVAATVAAAVLGCNTTMHAQSSDKVMIKTNPSGTHIKVMDKHHGK